MKLGALTLSRIASGSVLRLPGSLMDVELSASSVRACFSSPTSWSVSQGHFFLGESLTGAKAIGVAVILVGIGLVAR